MHKTQDKTLSSPFLVPAKSKRPTTSDSADNVELQFSQFRHAVCTMCQALCMGVRNQRATQKQKQDRRYTQNKIKEGKIRKGRSSRTDSSL